MVSLPILHITAAGYYEHRITGLAALTSAGDNIYEGHFQFSQSINQSINTLLTCCNLTSGVMVMQALPPAEARVIRTPDQRMKQ